MAIRIDPRALDSRVKDGALLAGLLEPDPAGQSLVLQEDWFADPPRYIKEIPRRPESLLDLLADLLGPADADLSSDGSTWHPISYDGKPTGLYVALSSDHGVCAAHVGLGLSHSFQMDGITITPSAHLPIFAPDAEDPRFVLGQHDAPLQMVVAVRSKTPFTTPDISFWTLEIEIGIHFEAKPPGVAVRFLDEDGETAGEFHDLRKLIDASAADWLNAVLVTEPVTAWLNKKIGSSEQTVGTLLSGPDIGILVADGTDGGYRVGDLGQFLEKEPLAVVQAVIFAALSVLADQQKPLVPVGEDGLYVVRRGESEQYGVRVCLPDIELSKESEDGGDKEGAPKVSESDKKRPETDNDKKPPRFKLQLGKWFTGEEEDDDAWLKRACTECDGLPNPGIALYLIERVGGEIAFKPRLELVSVGLDYVGDEKNPLISVKGFELGGIEPRVYVALDFDDPGSIVYGYGIRLDRLGIPLGAQVKRVSGKNPVAAGLLASGDEGEKSGEGKEDAESPAFSVSGSYVDKLSVQLYGPDDELTDTVWFPVQRAYGPLSCKRIGVGWEDATRILSLLFDGSVSVDVVTIDLIGLSVGIPITAPTNLDLYSLGLDGLALDVKAGPVEISGGLIQTTEGDVVSYQGQALIKTSTFAIDAYGSYTTVDGSPSLYIFALVNYPLGGPPCFFVMGLAAGFGYNSALRVPAIEQVKDFPLLAAMVDAGGTAKEDPTPGTMLASLSEWITPQRGAYWLAAGISFRSFEIIKSDVLAIVEFGQQFQVSVVGFSTIKLPQAGRAYAYAELMIRIIVNPGEGLISAMALLTSESYVIDPACRLTGGFAFCVWFGNSDYAGDFVLTIGGYHPSFQVPDHYPQVPRLGFNWALSGNVTIKGEAYFALTSSAVMAGGGLEVLYHSGNLNAWFVAHVDMIIYWKPFYFEAGLSVRIGASYRLNLLFVRVTLKVELSASVELWGPPTGGRARISWSIISFTVSFGADRLAGPRAVNWDGFKSMLPERQNGDVAASRALVTGDVATGRVPTDPDLAAIQINVSSGLLQQANGGGNKKVWIIRPDEFVFSVETAIPLTEVTLVNPATHENPEGEDVKLSGAPVGIRPMGIRSIASTQTVTIVQRGEEEPLGFDRWQTEPHTRSMPEAMWGPPVASLKAEAKLVAGCLIGVKNIRLKPHAAPNGPPKFVMDKAFTYFPVDRCEDETYPDYLPLVPAAGEPGQSSPTRDDSLDLIRDSLAAVADKRTALFEALADLGVGAGTDGDLSALAKNPEAGLSGSPMVGSPLGGTGERRQRGD